MVHNDNVGWACVRRFSDFDALQWSLKPLGPPWSEAQLPPKRFWNRHEPAFLQERKVLLQQYLDGLLCLPAPPAPLRDFLEVDVHVGMDDVHQFSPIDGMMDVNAEHDRLRSIVDDTSAALIDVSRVGNDDFVLDPEAPKTAQLCILREATAVGRQVDGSVGMGVNGTGRLPVPSALVSTGDGLLDTLTRAPAVPRAVQTQLVERCGLALVDTIREASKVEIGEGHDLVAIMATPDR
mmetsp:Transcript_72859/g.207575  ORF Transcript_72859/g.207575 Transcript_72859/m.207575 type:complete len:237 (-) Transcript_72859:99-809(-)